MTQTASSGSERDVAWSTHVWVRWLSVWNFAFFGLLALSTTFALLDGPQSSTRRAATLGLALGLGAWYRQAILLRKDRIQSPLPIVLYFGLTIPIYLGLAYLHPAYQLMLFALYLQIFSFLPLPWAIPGATVLTSLQWWQATNLSSQPMKLTTTSLLIFVLSLAGSITMALFIDAIIRQSEERQRFIEELQAARDDLVANERRAGRLEERQRLAREIHDTLAQGFTGIVMHLEAAEDSMPPGFPEARRHLDQARRTARESLAEARRAIWALRPEQLESASLPESLARLAERWSEENLISSTVSVTGTPRAIPPEVEVTLLRAAQEALANVRKHAHAKRAAVTLSYMEIEGLVTLDVRDDGVGFDPTAVPGRTGNDRTECFGLQAMRERVEALDGRVTVESEPGGGTTLTVQIPSAVYAGALTT